MIVKLSLFSFWKHKSVIILNLCVRCEITEWRLSRWGERRVSPLWGVPTGLALYLLSLHKRIQAWNTVRKAQRQKKGQTKQCFLIIDCDAAVPPRPAARPHWGLLHSVKIHFCFYSRIWGVDHITNHAGLVVWHTGHFLT